MDTDDTLVNLSIIPASPGYLTVYDLDDDFEACEPIIAWRVETRRLRPDTPLHTETYPITIDGEPASNCVGTQAPDGKVYLFSTGESFDSLAELTRQRRGSQA